MSAAAVPSPMVNTGKQMLRRAVGMIINLVREQKEESEEEEEEDEVCNRNCKKKKVTHGRSKCYEDSSEVCWTPGGHRI
jgi:hypothetical protein